MRTTGQGRIQNQVYREQDVITKIWVTLISGTCFWFSRYSQLGCGLDHRPNFVNNTWGGGSTMGIRNLETSILRSAKRRVSFFFCLYATQIIVFKIFQFLLLALPLQISSQKILFLGGKNT